MNCKKHRPNRNLISWKGLNGPFKSKKAEIKMIKLSFKIGTFEVSTFYLECLITKQNEFQRKWLFLN